MGEAEIESLLVVSITDGPDFFVECPWTASEHVYEIPAGRYLELRSFKHHVIAKSCLPLIQRRPVIEKEVPVGSARVDT